MNKCKNKSFYAFLIWQKLLKMKKGMVKIIDVKSQSNKKA